MLTTPVNTCCSMTAIESDALLLLRVNEGMKSGVKLL